MYSKKHRKRGEHMSIKERERLKELESIAKQIVALPEESKPFVMGYLFGKEEERQKWKKQEKSTNSVA